MPYGVHMETPEKNMVNAGIIFMFTAWLQGQMSDLIIFKNNPNLISDFVKNPTRVPPEFYSIRVSYWEKQFGSVKNEFKEAFSDILADDEKRDVEELYHLRNMIAHAHVSVGRDYMLYRPFGGERREQKLIDDLQLQPIDDQSAPMVLKIELWREDSFKHANDLIERLEQVTLRKVADSIGVPHSRIR
tara:strand:+ start:386 stop:949 length:564 start_codon:yes stop_codon:yes gene_type:complete